MLRREFNSLFQILLNEPRSESLFQVDVNLVNVYCTVRGKDARYVNDLSPEEVEVRDEGIPQRIVHFSRETDAPLTIALLIDVSGSVAGAVAKEREAAQRFFKEAMRPHDRGMLVGFWSAVTVWQDLTDSAQILGEAIEREVHPMPAVPSSYEAQLRGGTLLYDAVKLVCTQKLVRRTGRKVIILITDGLDQGSLIKNKEAARSAQEADAIVYGIHFDGNAYRSRDGLGALESLCDRTGGRALKVGGSMTLGRIFGILGEEMRSQYAIAYKRPEDPREQKYRKIDVKVRRPGLKVYAREGYFTRSSR